MIASFRATAERLATELVLVVDDDDPELPGYRAVAGRSQSLPTTGALLAPDPVRIMVLPREQSRDLTSATNLAAERIWGDDVIIGHVGDDHAFRTPGWDTRIRAVLEQPGVAYGDDLLQGPVLPTAAFLSAIIPRTLGWYALPGTRHMKIDTAWRVLGERLGRLHYLPDVVIEHLHPAAGKAERDAGYDAARDGARADTRVYRAWVKHRLKDDIRRVRAAMG